MRLSRKSFLRLPCIPALLAACALLGACGGGDDGGHDGGSDGGGTDAPLLQSGFESALTNQRGCSDLIIYAYNQTNNTVLFLRNTDGWVAMANETQMAITQTVDLAEMQNAGNTEVGVSYGFKVSELYCNDAVSVDVREIERWNAISGTAQVTIQPDPNYDPAQPTPGGSNNAASATFTNLVFELPSSPGTTITVPSMTIADVMVGWLPG